MSENILEKIINQKQIKIEKLKNEIDIKDLLKKLANKIFILILKRKYS